MTPDEASAFANEWVDAFNTHDLKRILDHYHEDVELTSPVYLRATDGESGTLRGREALQRYFARGIGMYPNLQFTLIEAFAGIGSVSVRYHTTVGDKMACEVMELDGGQKIKRVLAHYA